jgi:DNA topoisomerase-2
MKSISVEVKSNKGILSVSIFNDGKGIPVEVHPKENIYIPELIFGHLLTGSNFNDDNVSNTTL